MRQKNFIHFLTLSGIIIVSFLLLQPKVSSLINPLKREALWQRFEKKITTAPFNPRDFWIFREFYYPGYFTFKREGMRTKEYQFVSKPAGFTVKKNIYFYPFLTYRSAKIVSVEALVATHDLSKLITISRPVHQQLLVQNKSIIMEYINPKTIRLFFIQPYRAFIKTNGFLNYHEPDKNLAKNKSWFVASVIYLD